MRLVTDEEEEGGDDAMIVLIQENLFENCFTIPSVTNNDSSNDCESPQIFKSLTLLQDSNYV